MAKKTASKKKSSAKRTPAQRRAIRNLVAHNKARAKKKTASKKKTATRSISSRRPRQMTPNIRKRNPAQYRNREYYVVRIDRIDAGTVFWDGSAYGAEDAGSATLYPNKNAAMKVARELSDKLVRRSTVKIYVARLNVKMSRGDLESIS